MSASLKAACIQLNSGPAIDANIAMASDLVRRARDQGADFILTPEVSDMIEPKRALALDKAKPESEHAMLAAFRELARETGAWLLLGSIVVHDKGAERLANRSFLLNPAGEIAARYDKIHMFDVDLQGGECHRESKSYRPGDQAVLGNLPWGIAGLSVCYDLRFPHLYRALAKAGADFLTVPSAFTVPTGRAQQDMPMRAAGRHGEGRRHGEEIGARLGQRAIQMREAQIVADAEPGDAPGSVSYTHLDAADDLLCVDLGGRRIIK